MSSLWDRLEHAPEGFGTIFWMMVGFSTCLCLTLALILLLGAS